MSVAYFRKLSVGANDGIPVLIGNTLFTLTCAAFHPPTLIENSIENRQSHMSLYTGPMRCRFASLRLAAAAVFLVSVASIALIVAAMLDTVVDVSLPMPRDLSAQPAALIIDDRTDGRIRRDGSSSVDDEVRRRGLDRPLRIGVERLVPDSRINSGSARFEPTPIHGVAVADYADDDGGPETADRDRSTTTTSAEWETDDWLLGRLPVSDGASIWPSGSLPAGALQDDRILAQLRYVPRSVSALFSQANRGCIVVCQYIRAK